VRAARTAVLVVALVVVMVVAGAVTSVAAVAVHQRWWGLALAGGAVLATVLALPRGWWARPPFALGFVGVLGVAMSPRDEGDYLVPGNASGYALLGLGLAVLLVAVATLPRRPPT
jgi:hypothetical protein